MKKTLLNSALANMTGALALTIMLGAGVAFAADNGASAGDDQIAVQDALNGSLNGNLSGNSAYSDNDNDGADVDLRDVANGSLNGNLSGNAVNSGNDNDDADIDVALDNVGNDTSRDDNDGIDADIHAEDMLNDKSTTSISASYSSQDDHSLRIENVALLLSSQELVGTAARVNMGAYSGDVSTGSVVFGADANKMFAGNKTTSINTGAGSVALAASAIQANGDFRIGN